MTGMFYEWPVHGAEEKVCSITTGVVKNNWSQEYPGMVQAEYFLGTKGSNVTGWMPVAVPYAYKDCGMYALPEIGAEVVIAFNMGDRNCPIVIGSLWNQENVLPADTAVEKNTVKRFRTRGGCEVVFTEEEGKEAVEIHTPAALRLRIEDENQTVLLADKEQKNSLLIECGDGNVRICADKKVIFEVGGREMLALDANDGSLKVETDDISAKASKGCTIKGQNVALEGAQVDLKGNSQLSVQSGGIAQIKGTTVKIN